MRLNRQPPVHLFSKQPAPRRVHSPRKNGREQWTCPTGLATRAGFQPDAALRGFTLQSGGGERSCSPAAGPPDPLQTGAGTSAGFASQSPPGRICTCVDPLRGRRPELLGHGESGPRGGTPTRNPAFEAPHDGNFTTRGKKWSPHENLHLDLELRGLASCLLDDEGKNWSQSPGSHRPGLTYKVGTSLATSDGHWLPRRVTLPALALI